MRILDPGKMSNTTRTHVEEIHVNAETTKPKSVLLAELIVVYTLSICT